MPATSTSSHYRRRSNRQHISHGISVISSCRMEHLRNDRNPFSHRPATTERTGCLRLVHPLPGSQGFTLSGNTLTIEAPAVCAEELTTNDICEFNAQGQFHILGRKDNTVNTGGVKVQIEQVENALKTALPVPFMVTAVPDPKFGECIVLLLESEENTDVSPLLAQAYDQLPTYWRPKQTFFVRHLPQPKPGNPTAPPHGKWPKKSQARKRNK